MKKIINMKVAINALVLVLSILLFICSFVMVVNPYDYSMNYNETYQISSAFNNVSSICFMLISIFLFVISILKLVNCSRMKKLLDEENNEAYTQVNIQTENGFANLSEEDELDSKLTKLKSMLDEGKITKEYYDAYSKKIMEKYING